MPLFEYKCDKCGQMFEKIEKHSASTTKKCPKCGNTNVEQQWAAMQQGHQGSGRDAYRKRCRNR